MPEGFTHAYLLVGPLESRTGRGWGVGLRAHAVSCLEQFSFVSDHGWQWAIFSFVLETRIQHSDVESSTTDIPFSRNPATSVIGFLLSERL